MSQRSAASPFVVPVLLVITLSAFAGTLRCGFVNFDDPTYITDNSFIRDGLTLPAIRWALTHRVQHLYHPLTLLSFALDVQMFGIAPAGFHLENLLLHCANVVLLYRLLLRLTADSWRSALVAAVWAIHPQRVESVAWVTERKDVLMAFFGLLCFGAYVEWTEHPRPWRFVQMCLLLCLSLLAKPTLMVVPFLLLLLDFWPLGRTPLWRGPRSTRPKSWPTLILEKLPIALICGAIVAASALGPPDSTPPPNAAGAITVIHRIDNVLTSSAQYAIKMIDVRNLAVYYPIPLSWPLWQVLASILLLAAMTLTAILQYRSRPWLAMGWLWFLGLLAPVIGLFYATNYSLADRYTYLPSIGLLICIVWSLPASLASGPIRKCAAGIVTSSILLFLGIVTAEDVKYWSDSTTLWARALEVTHDNWLAECNYALAVEADGRPDRAMPHYQAAVRFNPQSAQAHFNYGAALERSGNIPGAIEQYRAAIKIFPLYSKASLAAGTLLMNRDRFAQAAGVFAAAAQHDPVFQPLVYCSRGADLLQHDRPRESIAEFRKALQAQPDYFLAHMGLGVALLKTGEATAAVEQFKAAGQLKPDDPAVQKNLRIALAAASTQSSTTGDKRQ